MGYASYNNVLQSNTTTTLAAGMSFDFPNDGATSGVVGRVNTNTFDIQNVGVYYVQYVVNNVTGQLVLNTTDISGTTDLLYTLSQSNGGVATNSTILPIINPNTLLTLKNPTTSTTNTVPTDAVASASELIIFRLV